MGIVTLTTDFGSKDYYVGVLKGAMLIEQPNLTIIDLSHHVRSHDIVQASFILKNSYRSFPKGTIHIVSVNNFYSPDKQFIVFQHEGYFFIGPDNGIFSLIFNDLPNKIYLLPFIERSSFPLKNVYANAIRHIFQFQSLENIGTTVDFMQERITLQPVTSRNQIKGSIIYIDAYENTIVNISKELFDRIGEKRPFELFFKRHDPITYLSNHYYDVPVGETLCLFNSSDYLEIAVNMGNAASLLGLKVDDTIQINFL